MSSDSNADKLYVGQKIIINIKDIAFGGNGVGVADNGQTIFVPYSAPGDKLRVEIRKVKKRFAEAVIDEILEPAECRVKPKSENYGVTPVSQYEHLVYEKQLEIKQKQLVDQLTRIGKLDISETEQLPIVESPEKYNYRNKIKLHPVRLTEDYLDYGFVGEDNKSIIGIRRSELVKEAINKTLPKLNKMKWGKKNATRKKPLNCTIRSTTNGDAHAFFGKAPENYPWLVEQINEFEVRVPLGSFFQVNIPVAEEMFKTVANWVEATGAESAIDSYCGVGVFGLHLPAEMEVFTFDIDESAVRAAQVNTLNAGLVNRRFYCGSDKVIFNEIIHDCNPAETVIIMDPPRTGCDQKALEKICKADFKAIVMISCNPATMARDLSKIMESGKFKIDKIQAFDMFPQTSHFEAAALITKK